MSDHKFDTQAGKDLTSGLQGLYERYNLSYAFGTAPQDYYLTRAPYPSNTSLLSFVSEQAIPVGLAVGNPRADIPNLSIINSGGQRFDLYAGDFTTDDQFKISTYPNAFVYIANVTLGDANQVFSIMNEEGETRRRRSVGDDELAFARGDVEGVYRAWLEEMFSRWTLSPEKRSDENMTVGYVTSDVSRSSTFITIPVLMPVHLECRAARALEMIFLIHLLKCTASPLLVFLNNQVEWKTTARLISYSRISCKTKS